MEADGSISKITKGGGGEEGREVTQEDETTLFLTLKDLQDMQKDYSCQPGEQIAAWLLQCWDSGANSQKLECKEAQQLGTCPWDQGIDREIRKETIICSLWRQLLSSMKARYPFKKDLLTYQGEWTSAGKYIQYLGELEVLKVIHSGLDDNKVSKDPDDSLCIWTTWRKLVQMNQHQLPNNLTTMYFPDLDMPSV
ncbi:ubiquitin carboxyl-terminal hydrolase 4 [Limosa lapponica baueri]|uniref:Ubiquitin carboxyl-terminal hydrolase 4 n=1 Tax=Limosa lapponica baueri TaxID=1758121 RepID=A0A2I0UFQ6_LIMLA|nr:ubiquitin carboxyl-terminal hydrolase 4 [Limosa lapponica baueri]